MPWWANDKNLIHKIAKMEFGEVRMYARCEERAWTYAYVERRAGTFYLFGLYCDGASVPINAQSVYRKEWWE